MNPTQAVVWLKRVKRNLPRETEKETGEFAKYAHSVLLTYFSGTSSSTQLAKRGHPYGVMPSDHRGPIPYGNAAVVNAQTGAVRRSWTLVRISDGWRLTTDSEIAKLLDAGTKFMIRRPFRQQVLSIVLPQRLPRMQRAILRALK